MSDKNEENDNDNEDLTDNQVLVQLVSDAMDDPEGFCTTRMVETLEALGRSDIVEQAILELNEDTEVEMDGAPDGVGVDFSVFEDDDAGEGAPDDQEPDDGDDDFV